MAECAVSQFPVRPSALHQAANVLKKWAPELNINPYSISVLTSLLPSCQSKFNVTHIHKNTGPCNCSGSGGSQVVITAVSHVAVMLAYENFKQAGANPH